MIVEFKHGKTVKTIDVEITNVTTPRSIYIACQKAVGGQPNRYNDDLDLFSAGVKVVVKVTPELIKALQSFPHMAAYDAKTIRGMF